MKYKHGCLTVFLLTQLNTLAHAETPYRFHGFYFGETAGHVTSRFDSKTSTKPGPLLDLSETNQLNQLGYQKVDQNGFLSGMEGGYNWQFNPWMLGLEADLETLSTSGEKNTNAVTYANHPDRQFVVSSYANNNWLLSFRPRIGVVANNWLLYATGGLALTYLQSDFLFSNNDDAFASKRVSQMLPGYILGGGVETGLTNHVSLKAEYLFLNFPNANGSNMNHHSPSAQTFLNSVNLKSNIMRLGVNYHFDDQGVGMLATGLFNPDLWETEMGVRLFLSTGIDGAPQPLFGGPNVLFSRLIFSDLKAISGETFARIDHVSGVFAKGYLGAGSITTGKLNDEDFPAGGAYSNTLSNVSGNLSYATIDAGYSFIKTPMAKTGAFVGYNYYAENLNAYNCYQQAGSTVCIDSSEFTKFMGISQDDQYNSLRLGVTTQFDLTEQLTLLSEAAYLPLAGIKGKDIHNARQLVGPEQSSYADGAMLEAILDYQFAKSWNVGLGGRYWMWNSHGGTVDFDFLGEADTSIQPARYNAERYGVFLQFSYHDRKSNHADIYNTPFNWKGIYVGGHLGGALGISKWSDPFGETPALFPLVNVPGFGDKIRSTGPLGGLDLNFLWQAKQFVYGLGAALSGADICGENTLFSGLGGVNGQAVTHALGTLTGRLGFATNRSLYYVNAGSALLNTTYSVNANTSALTFGSESKTLSAWGYAYGVGVEYALNDHWTSNVEYDYVHIPSQRMTFGSIDVIGDQAFSVRQSMNIYKLGINYKFDVFG